MNPQIMAGMKEGKLSAWSSVCFPDDVSELLMGQEVENEDELDFAQNIDLEDDFDDVMEEEED